METFYVFDSLLSYALTYFFMHRSVYHLGRVVRKLVNANPGLNVNRSNNFPSTEMFFSAYVLCSLKLLMLKTEGQKI